MFGIGESCVLGEERAAPADFDLTLLLDDLKWTDPSHCFPLAIAGEGYRY